MDSGENGGKQEKPEELALLEETSNSEANGMDYEELLQKLRASTQNTLAHLDKLIQSSSPKGTKKTYLELFRALIEENAKSSESIIYLFEYVIDLRASILLLSADIEKAQGKTAKDVKKLKAKINTLLNSPAMVEIGKVLHNIQRITNERKRSEEKNPTTEYLR